VTFPPLPRPIKADTRFSDPGRVARLSWLRVDLRLVDVGGVAVAHRARFDAAFTLEVALPVKLLADAPGPLPVQVERLGRVAQVGAVQQVL